MRRRYDEEVRDAAPIITTGLSTIDRPLAERLAGARAGADAHPRRRAAATTGEVRAWGANGSGQVGDGTLNPRATPVAVSGLGGVVAVATGFRHSLAIMRDGTVRAWGWNGYGQLGDGTVTTRRTPVPVNGLSNVTAVTGGYGHTLALKGDRSAWSWGRNNVGQLGDGTLTDRGTPAPVSGLGGVVAVSAGDYHNLAVMVDGTVRAWGQNTYGQLGDGTTVQRTTPVVVSGLGGVVVVAAGYIHSLAVKGDGSAWAWGDNSFGKLGDGTATDRHTPVAVRSLSAVTAVTAGNSHSLALVAVETGPTFADVPTNYWAYAQIEKFASRGITTGCDTNSAGERFYCPDRGVTRAEMAVFLDRVLGQSELAPATPTFADVPKDYWAYGWIEQFASLGITTGCGNDEQGRRLFCPDRGVTRAEMAAFIDRAKGLGPLNRTPATFVDVPTDYWAYGFIEQFVEQRITTGCDTNSAGERFYCPDRGVTRAEMAVFIIRAFP